MKEYPKDNPDDIIFSPYRDNANLIKQAEFFVAYYSTLLKLLKSENMNLYITAEQAAEEVFYKDIIAGCMLLIQEHKNIKKQLNERPTRKS